MKGRKVLNRICSFALAVLLMVSAMGITARADGENAVKYEPTDTYVLKYGDTGSPEKNYASRYKPEADFINTATGTWKNGTRSPAVFALHNMNSGEILSAYCTDNYTTTVKGSEYQRLNLEDSIYAQSGAGMLRAIIKNSFPFVTLEEMRAASGVADLTVCEAVNVAQLAVWEMAHPDLFEVTKFVDEPESKPLVSNWEDQRSSIRYFDECNEEFLDGKLEAIKESNYAEPIARMEAAYNYLIGLEPENASSEKKVVSKASFTNWTEPVAVKNADGSYNVSVDVTVDVNVNSGDKLTLSAVLDDGTYFISTDLADGTNSKTLTIANVPAEAALGEVKLAIDGHQKSSDVYLFDAEGERGTSQSMIGMCAEELPVHAEITAERPRIIHFEKMAKVPTGETGTDGKPVYKTVPLSDIVFDLYLVATMDEYSTGAVEIPEKITVSEYYKKHPAYTVTTDNNGKATVNLTQNSLPDGVYAVIERENIAVSEPVEPFYVVIPATTPDGGSLVYELTVKPKNEVIGDIKIEKDVISLGNDWASVDAYKAHTWIIGATIPLDIADGKKYEINDNLSNQLDYLGNIKVQVEDKTPTAESKVLELKKDQDYVLTETLVDSVATKDSDAFKISLTAAGMRKIGNYVGSAVNNYMIRVYFDAQINSNAKVAEEIPNKATLKYTNSVNFDFNAESDVPEVVTGGAKLLKVDAADKVTTLAGATFKVYRPATAEEIADEKVITETIKGISVPVMPVEFFDNAALTGNKVTSVTSNADGVVLIYGLAYNNAILDPDAEADSEENTYYLVETEAPDGYNLLTKPLELKVSATSHLDTSVIKVENNAGFELPQTGGIGTTIFTMTGLILMLGAGIILVTRRRMYL